VGQFIELLRLADVDASDLVHLTVPPLVAQGTARHTRPPDR
jgi:hypothetical protein